MVETNPDKIYTMRFLLGQVSDGCQEPMVVIDFVGDQVDCFHFNNPPTNNIYEPNNVTFTAKAEQTCIVYVKLHELVECMIWAWYCLENQ